MFEVQDLSVRYGTYDSNASLCVNSYPLIRTKYWLTKRTRIAMVPAPLPTMMDGCGLREHSAEGCEMAWTLGWKERSEWLVMPAEDAGFRSGSRHTTCLFTPLQLGKVQSLCQELLDLCEVPVPWVSVYSSLKWGFWLDDLWGPFQLEHSVIVWGKSSNSPCD